MAEDTILLHFEVDQGAAEQDLKKIEQLLLQNKEAQQELTAAYKKGNITQEEYVEENIRLQQNIKKEQDQKKTLIRTLETESNSRNSLRQKIGQLTKEQDNLNVKTAAGAKRSAELEKELLKLNTQLNKSSKAAGNFKNNIGNYPQQLSVAGVSIADVGAKLASFANPATAAVGILTALGTAYARSAVGARDLEKAQSLVSTTTEVLSNAFGNFIGQTKEGDGIITRLTQSLLDSYLPAVSGVVKAIADAKQTLRDLEISRAFAAGDAKESERKAELARRDRDDERKFFDERIAASEKIDALLEASGQRTKIVIQAQIQAIKDTTLNYDLNRQAILQVAQLTAEIADKEEEITGKLTENVAARNKIIQAQRESLELLGMEIRDANAPNVSLAQPESPSTAPLTDPIIILSKARQDQAINELDTVEMTEDRKQQFYRETAELQAELDRQQLERERAVAMGVLAIGSSLSHGLASLAKEDSELQKTLALTGIAFDTAAAIAGGVAASQDVGYPANLAAMASTIAAIFAAISQAESIIGGFADGGWTGPGARNKAVGIVHADEYVTPKHIVHSPAAQPHLAALESMRVRGYADGGFVTNQSTASAQQALIMANALKNLPIPKVSWVEGRDVGRRVEWKENVSTLGR